MTGKAHRFHHLDSLRGLAALTVVIHHFLITVPAIHEAPAPDACSPLAALFLYSPLRIFWAGHEAVMFFFVLSGFVLSIPFWRRRSTPLGTYMLKRVIRLYPPYIISVIIAMIACALLSHGPQEGIAYWLNRAWAEPVSAKHIVQHATMIGFYGNHLFNPVLWSLVHEMRISLLFPIFFLLLRRWEHHPVRALGFFALFSVMAWGYDAYKPIKLGADSLDTLHYLGFFGIGALLFRYRPALITRYLLLTGWQKILLLLAGAIAYTNAYWLPWISAMPTYKAAPAAYFLRTLGQEWITASGVVIFLIASFGSGRLSHILDWKPIRFLGDISYSLYLVHCILLKIFLALLYGKTSLISICLLTFATSIVFAWLGRKFIEEPTIRLCQRISARGKKATVPPASAEAIPADPQEANA
jgi:peptidoglycan/LPS O-acetylase OafA/YrhL